MFDGLMHTSDTIIDDEYLFGTGKDIREELKKHVYNLKNNKNYFPRDLREHGAFLYFSERKVYLEENLNENKNCKYTKVDDDVFNMFFCFKYYNGQKLDSHKWFLKGFCRLVKSVKYFAFIDCGTKPEKDSLFKLYRAMVGDSQIAGVCGYMSLYRKSMLDSDFLRIDKEW